MNLLVKMALGVAVLLNGVQPVRAQAVRVSVSLQTNVILVGSTTLLQVSAQVLPAYRADADRIFSWYVDLHNSNAVVAAIMPAQLQKPASDNDPLISSFGFLDGSRLRGIYDTFMNLPAAGKNEPVVLLDVPIRGLTGGQVTFAVRPGSGVSGLAADFIVAPLGGGEPWLGGDYSTATVTLTVVNPQVHARVDSIHVVSLTGGLNRVELRFPPPTGYQAQVEYCDLISPARQWKTLPGGPFTGGLAVDPAAPRTRFYRMRFERSP